MQRNKIVAAQQDCCSATRLLRGNKSASSCGTIMLAPLVAQYCRAVACRAATAKQDFCFSNRGEAPPPPRERASLAAANQHRAGTERWRADFWMAGMTMRCQRWWWRRCQAAAAAVAGAAGRDPDIHFWICAHVLFFLKKTLHLCWSVTLAL